MHCEICFRLLSIADEEAGYRICTKCYKRMNKSEDWQEESEG